METKVNAISSHLDTMHARMDQQALMLKQILLTMGQSGGGPGRPPAGSLSIDIQRTLSLLDRQTANDARH